jgi:hypothetical protein
MKDRNYMPGMIVVNNMFSINFDGYENSEYALQPEKLRRGILRN